LIAAGALVRSRTLADCLAVAIETLERSGLERPRLEAEWLLAGVLDVPRLTIYAALDREADADLAARFAATVRRRAAGEPLQHILGWEEFRGLRLRVSRDVLVPRPETEVLVDHALLRLPAPGDRRLVVIDVGTGSGCIAAAIAAARPDVRVVPLDVSSAAMPVASDNLDRLNLSQRVALVVADLLAPIRSCVADLIVSNPPYLPESWLAGLPREVRDWDPRIALEAGDDGLAVLRPLVADAYRVLKPGGALAVETAGESQVDAVATLFDDAGYVDIDVSRDLAGTRRFVTGRAPDLATTDRSRSRARALPAQRSGGGSEGAVEAPFER
jgi:release factor glutamine methyltransferase